MMTTLRLNVLKKIDINFIPKARRPDFKALSLLIPLALFAAPSAIAQISSMNSPAPPFVAPLAPVAPLVAAASPAAFAELAALHPLQLPVKADGNSSASTVSEDALPQDPSALHAVSSSQANHSPSAQDLPQDPGARHVAPIYTKYIPAGWTAQPITARDKFLIGARDLVDPLNFAAIFVSAGWEQLTNGQPNYGTDRGAFGERLGAAGIRETTQGFFTDSIFAPLLHEDPRYYVEGPDYSFIHRALYAGTRPLITRTDNGSTSINGALLFGYAASSALSYTYYPKINQNFQDTVATFGGGIGGAALGFVVSEFSADVLQKLHLEKKP